MISVGIIFLLHFPTGIRTGSSIAKLSGFDQDRRISGAMWTVGGRASGIHSKCQALLKNPRANPKSPYTKSKYPFPGGVPEARLLS